MRFGILGPLQAEYPDGRPVPLGGPRLRALLAMLLLDAGHPVGIDRLIDGLYGEHPPAGAGNALQSQVSRLRQTLPVELDPAGYRLAVEPDEVDAHRFAALAAEGRQALAADEPERAAAVLRSAAALWRGEPLADVRDAPFAAPHAARLTELRLTAAEDLHEVQLRLSAHPPAAGGDETRLLPAHAITELRELIAAHPLRERPRALLMRALVAAGRPAEALAAYEDARRTLAEELGADPSPELTAVHTAVLRGTAPPPAPGAPRPSATSVRVNQPGPSATPGRSGLPTQLTSFVGRETELSRVAAALRTARLVTLHGPGGAGKTRLAVESAARHDTDVCFVELAAAGGDQVPRAVLSALGLRDLRLNDRPAAEPPTATDRLLAALADRRLLLVLDNCEHVVEAAAALAGRLLAAAPRVRVLATSREPLGITGETLVPVSGLPVPPAGAAGDDLAGFAAVRLFAERAADVSPGFAVTPENAAAVRRVCRMLDGLPLAVELAAARLHALPVAEVAARLDDRFRLLSRGSRTAESRHRTLQAVVAWSWDLLTEPERVLARRFTVFAGSAGLDAVERVCGSGIPPAAAGGAPETVEVLTSLVGKSLIERDGARYRMLATIQAYCADRLAESGERDRMRRAHAAYFLGLARTADPMLRTAEQLTWLDRLDADRDNLHAALRRSSADGDAGTALRLVSALSFYWWLRGLRAEATGLARQVLRETGAEPPPGRTEEYALCVLNATLGGTEPPAPRWANYMMTLTEPPAQPFLLYLSAMAVGPPDAAPDEVVALNRRLRAGLGGQPWSDALGGIGGGWMLLFAGATADEAEADFVSALAGFREIGERWGAMLALSGVAEMAIWRGDPAGAIEPMDEALRLAGELGSSVDVADLLRGRGEGRLSAGDLAGAAEDFVRSAELARECGAPELVAAALLGHGAVALSRGDLAEAAGRCQAALDACPVGWYGADGTRMAILVTLGRIAEATGDAASAAARYRQVFTVRAGMLGFQVMAEAIDRLAALALADGDAEQAATLLGTVLALRLRPEAEATELAAQVAGTARAKLGPDRYAAAAARGSGLRTTEAYRLLQP
ncbi:AfsR/SARP family transcriptional regulator [Actinoplanes aureus]|uniref:AAA family ATPase n=1 Tax=Actinoplanes aureus TaxID=2792083 RepID=A0A931FX52_9ACTN|nr:BTAD domain-containing putative transcriptional regulator [Actinoplanes aureus]MBG0562095.1 AAA family ATPase [Actinoplanes aureus]